MEMHDTGWLVIRVGGVIERTADRFYDHPQTKAMCIDFARLVIDVDYTDLAY